MSHELGGTGSLTSDVLSPCLLVATGFSLDSDPVVAVLTPKCLLPGGAGALSDVMLASSASFITVKACVVTAGRHKGVRERLVVTAHVCFHRERY